MGIGHKMGKGMMAGTGTGDKTSFNPASPQEELNSLKEQLAVLSEQLASIRHSIEQLENK
jgi:hypothetical protein